MPNDTEVLRFSRRVPEVGSNLAWIQFPSLDPTENISLVDTAKFIAENINLSWQEAQDRSILGTFINTEGTTGYVLITTYNATPSGGSASGAIATGSATYVVPRLGTTEIIPSGYVVNNYTSEIQVFHPKDNEAGVWRLQIQDGVIVRHHVLKNSDNSWLRNLYNTGDELVLFYSIPEAFRIPYLEETSFIDSRVLDVSGRVATVIDEHSIQLPDEDLYQVRSLLINGQQLITSESHMISEMSTFPAGPFSAWDPLTGRLSLVGSVDEDDEIIVSYRYREFLYSFDGYLDDNGIYHDLDLNPSPGHTYDNGRPSSELLSIPVYIYLVPTAAYRYRSADGLLEQERRIYTANRWTNAFLRWERTEQPVGTVDVIESDPCKKRSTFGHAYFGNAKFVDSVPVDTLSTFSSGGSGLANMPSAIVLAKIYVTSNSQVENVSLIDTRRRGGGVGPKIDPFDITLPGETRRQFQTYWDVSGWDGQPVPLAGVLLVEIPGDVLLGVNGYQQFSQDEIEKIVKSHVAAGVKVIVRYT